MVTNGDALIWSPMETPLYGHQWRRPYMVTNEATLIWSPMGYLVEQIGTAPKQNLTESSFF